MSATDRLSPILDVLDLLSPGCTAEITPGAVAEARRAVMELARKPLASVEGIVVNAERFLRVSCDGIAMLDMEPVNGIQYGQRVLIDVYAVGDKPGEE